MTMDIMHKQSPSLEPPTTEEYAGTAALSSLQYISGKKVTEINTAISDRLVPVITKRHLKDDIVVLNVSRDSSQNLLI